MKKLKLDFVKKFAPNINLGEGELGVHRGYLGCKTQALNYSTLQAPLLQLKIRYETDISISKKTVRYWQLPLVN